MRRIVSFLILSILALSSAFLAAGWQQNSEATQTSESVRSLFEGDPCAPPCWFGLVAGESRSEEALHVLRMNDDIFRPVDDSSLQYANFEDEEEAILEGFYQFNWRDTTTPGGYYPEPSLLVVEAGELDWMRISPPTFTTSDEVIAALGQPSEVRIMFQVYHLKAIFYYGLLNLMVVFQAEADNCALSQMPTDFPVEYLYYYSAKEADSFDVEGRRSFNVEVPDKTWTAWFSGQSEGSCEDVFTEYFSQPLIQQTLAAISDQISATSYASQATRNAQAWATVTARAADRLTATAAPR